MKPHINIGTIGNCNHGKTTLTAAIVAQLSNPSIVNPLNKEPLKIKMNQTENYTPTPVIVHYEPTPRKNYSMALMGIAALIGFPGMGGGGPSASSIRNDPRREKTQEDQKHIAIAKEKRERKNTQKLKNNQ